MNRDAVSNEQLVAIVTLIKEIMDQLDEVAYVRKSGGKAGVSSIVLGEMCSVLKSLPAELEECYFEVLLKIADKQKAPRHMVVSDDYVDLSVDARRRFVNKIRNELNIKAA